MKEDITKYFYDKIEEKNAASYLTLHFLNFLAVKHIKVFIAANVVALHLIVILIFVMCLKK